MNKLDYTLYKKIVKELDLTTVKPPRAGIIIYTKHNNELIFGLGVDTSTKELTDFGGGISYKERDKNVILGALREFNEETLNIFKFNYDDVLESLVLYNQHILLIFKYVDMDIDQIRQSFLNLCKPNDEVCDIMFLTKNEFQNCIMTRGKMFFRIQNFLQKAGNFYWLL